ncbi:MAG TPA: hypothetical protein DCZ01_07800 [Elusimicrobia bacterium]|nr:MAG: hypothetical protein A2X37_01225 [Elusimicrobia bacterium GWA2_66_18]HAZ08408.1 hypothetical protein [Elusimicrobiota bacterium]
MLISIVKRDSRLLILPITAMLMSVTGLVQAAQMHEPRPGGGAVRAWSVPFTPVSQGMMTGLQGFLKTETGEGLLAQVPSLDIIAKLTPDSEAHRRIVGALDLSADFEAQLQAAIKTADNKALVGHSRSLRFSPSCSPPQGIG